METCLYEALKLAGKEWTVEEVMAVVLRDRPFYEQSGGGLTISGGEPMLQAGFTRELLRSSQNRRPSYLPGYLWLGQPACL